jgi:hypothetical protein
MTLQEWLEEFKTIAPEFKWKRQYGSFLKGRIVGTHKNGLGFCGCPITCYYYSKYNKVEPDCSYRKVAEEIGLSRSDAEKIAYSADDCDDRGITNNFSTELKRTLLEITQLAEEKGGGSSPYIIS